MGANVEQKNTGEPREFVVTTFGSRPESGKGGSLVLDSGVWNGKTPYGLGYPIRWVLERAGDGPRLRRIDGRAEEIIANPLRALDTNQLTGEIPIELEPKKNLWITLQPVLELGEIARQGATHPWTPKALNVGAPPNAEADRFFKRSSIGVLAVSLVFLMAIRFMPTGQMGTEGLIPEQFAKVLLSPAVKSAAPKAKVNDDQSAPKSVVQAFRSKAVQKTAQSLFNPAAAKALLSRTSLLDAGTARAALKGVLDGKSKLSQSAGTGGVDLTGVGGARLPSGSASQGADYRSGAATATVGGGHTGLAAISYEAVSVSDGLTKDEVGKVIRDHIGQIRYCYEAALSRTPGLEGKLLVSFTVGADGTVKEVQTKESSGNLGLDRCIQSRLMKWTFPKPRQGVDIGVTYPFIFKSLVE